MNFYVLTFCINSVFKIVSNSFLEMFSFLAALGHLFEGRRMRLKSYKQMNQDSTKNHNNFDLSS